MLSVLPALYEGDSCDMPLYIHAANCDLSACLFRKALKILVWSMHEGVLVGRAPFACCLCWYVRSFFMIPQTRMFVNKWLHAIDDTMPSQPDATDRRWYKP